MKKQVDITGLMVPPVDNWQERARKLCNPYNFSVSIMPTWEVHDALSPTEYTRLLEKLTVVDEFARYMAAGMLKGTLKYATDTWSVEQWMAHLIGEGADQANYQALLFDAWRREEK